MLVNNDVTRQITGCEASDWEANVTDKFHPRKTIERIGEARLPTELGEFRIIGYRSLVSNEEFVVLTRGDF